MLRLDYTDLRYTETKAGSFDPHISVLTERSAAFTEAGLYAGNLSQKHYGQEDRRKL